MNKITFKSFHVVKLTIFTERSYKLIVFFVVFLLTLVQNIIGFHLVETGYIDKRYKLFDCSSSFVNI